ncbi:hypothetical protein ACFQ3Z_06120 [Streptomyces nogalater]
MAAVGGWRRYHLRVGGLAYRVISGRSGGTPTLAVTYSERVGPDPVAVRREDVEPEPARLPGYRRIGAVRATAYLGRRAAALEWLAGPGSARPGPSGAACCSAAGAATRCASPPRPRPGRTRRTGWR